MIYVNVTIIRVDALFTLRFYLLYDANLHFCRAQNGAQNQQEVRPAYVHHIPCAFSFASISNFTPLLSTPSQLSRAAGDPPRRSHEDHARYHPRDARAQRQGVGGHLLLHGQEPGQLALRCADAQALAGHDQAGPALPLQEPLHGALQGGQEAIALTAEGEAAFCRARGDLPTVHHAAPLLRAGFVHLRPVQGAPAQAHSGAQGRGHPNYEFTNYIVAAYTHATLAK